MKTMSAFASGDQNDMERVASSSSDSSGLHSENSTRTNAINRYDVLLGRGGLTNSHVGNKHFRAVVAEYQPTYLVAKKKDKKEIAKEIVARIHASGGRFLKRTADSEVWSEVTEKKALEKTSQSLRESLDVRHKKFRTDKVFHGRDGDENNPRKRARLVTGLVMESPKLTGMAGPRLQSFVGASSPKMGGGVPTNGNTDDIPDLRTEEGLGAESATSKFVPLFHFYPSERDHTNLSEDDCDHVLEI
jgi:hypothetical protein